jgi:alcohol dehydrogenase, propanol-preferring
MRSLQITEFGAPLAWSESDTPQPTGAEVLLETVACGVCHSDLHIWEGYYDLGGGKKAYVKDRGVQLPLTLGHEVVGRVVAKGPDARGVEIGDVRLAFPWIGCGECRECRAEREHLCGSPQSLGVFRHGGYSDHLLVPNASCLVEIGDLPPEAACSYACAGLTAYSALRKLPALESEDHVVIIGAGGVGLMALQIVREITSAGIIVVDLSDRNLEAARSLVDCVTINARGGSPFKQIREVAGRAGVAAVIDFVGSSDTVGLGFSLLAKNGSLIVVGLFGGELTIPTPTLPLKAVTIRGSYTGSLPELRELLAIARSGRLKPLPVANFPMEEAQHILERLHAGEVVGRAVLRPDQPAQANAPSTSVGA